MNYSDSKYLEITLKMEAGYTDIQLKDNILKHLESENIYLTDDSELSYQILHKSLDARKKSDIHWVVKVRLFLNQGSAEINKALNTDSPNIINIPYRRRDQKVIVAGSGPAGFFAAYVLQKAGFKTTIIERGSKVQKRETAIKEFESTGKFNSITNYAFGEGGAGTFSDGKLTSRSKHISKEKLFVLSSYVQAGAPEEIMYMAHPHLGSDNLKKIVKNLRESFINMGGTILFETMVKDLIIKNRKILGVVGSAISSEYLIDDCNNSKCIVNEIEADEVIIASGHSAYETYRMLMKNGVQFKLKNFAVGCRVEHLQELINLAQWGRKELKGVKAAEYRLTSRGNGNLPVYTFCMCPGGVIVPASAYKTSNIVNGMSRYMRNEKFANSACVAALNLNELLKKDVDAEEALNWLENLEHDFYKYSDGYAAPFCTIKDFIDAKLREDFIDKKWKLQNSDCNVPAKSGLKSTHSLELDSKKLDSSYPLGLKSAPLWELLPFEVSISISEGLKEFSRKIRGFETGLIMGLESKTSSPISVVREKDLCCTGFDNLYMAGEGSGHSGGIISSASDGIKAALSIIMKYS